MSEWTREEMDYIARELDRQARDEQPALEVFEENIATDSEIGVVEPTDTFARRAFDSNYQNIPNFFGYGSVDGIKKPKQRGFESVSEINRKFPFTEPTLPTRAESRSAGYDLYSPVDYTLAPYEKYTIWTDVKAYMLKDEVLNIYIRSSMAVKNNIQLINSVGVIDASYYNNDSNEGNIGVCLFNHSEEPYYIKAGDRIAQGVFQKYLTTDRDDAQHEVRVGGFGSTGR